MATIEQLEARLTELESRLPPVPTTQANPPITVGELTDVPAPGSPIASTWAQEVSNRVVQRFATRAALGAWLPADGARAYTVDQGRDWVRAGAGWQSVINYLPAGRTGVILIDSPQTFNTAVAADITWSAAEISDPDNWAVVGAAQLTVPVNLTGRYLIAYTGSWTGGAPGAGAAVLLSINGTNVLDIPTGPGTYMFTHQLTVLRTLAAGDTLKFSAFQNGGANRDLTSRLEISMVAA